MPKLDRTKFRVAVWKRALDLAGRNRVGFISDDVGRETLELYRSALFEVLDALMVYGGLEAVSIALARVSGILGVHPMLLAEKGFEGASMPVEPIALDVKNVDAIAMYDKA